jgi:hypothetical protein
MATMNRQTGFADRWQDAEELAWNGHLEQDENDPF